MKKKNVIQRWTRQEEQYLLEHYKTKEYRDIAEHLGRTEDAIKSRVSQVLQKRKTVAWTGDQEHILESLIGEGKTSEQIAKKLKRSRHSIDQHIRIMGISRNEKHITPEKVEFIKRNYHKMSNGLLARETKLPLAVVKNTLVYYKLKRSETAIERLRRQRKMGIEP